VVATIKEKRPAVVFAPHVETSAGMILPNDYITQVGRREEEEEEEGIGGWRVVVV